MALVSVGWECSITLFDKGSNSGTMQFELQAIDYTTAIASALAVVTALLAITNTVASNYRVTEVFGNDAFLLPVIGELENKASMTAQLAGAGEGKANLKVPGPIDGIFVGAPGSGANYNVVDVADALLIAYETVFKTGESAYVSDGQVITSFVSGKRIHAKSNRG